MLRFCYVYTYTKFMILMIALGTVQVVVPGTSGFEILAAIYDRDVLVG
jgi:hypothetical protein